MLAMLPNRAFAPEIDAARCDGCGRCVAACRRGVLAIAGGRVWAIHPEWCDCDGACEDACVRAVISLPYAAMLAPATEWGLPRD